MIREIVNMCVEVVGSDDGKNTYEVRRKWGDKGKKALVVELYPTISIEDCCKSDLSTMHLMNHVKELGWEELSIVNLYSEIFNSKPLVSQLNDDVYNISYIEEFLEKDDISDYDIVIAWGNSLSTHSKTINAKIDLLSMLKSKGLLKQVKCIITENLSVVECYGVHPLYLGLRYSNDKWSLVEYPVNEELEKLEKIISLSGKETSKGKSKKASKKTT